MCPSAFSLLHFRRIGWAVAGVPGWQLFQLSSGFRNACWNVSIYLIVAGSTGLRLWLKAGKWRLASG